MLDLIVKHNELTAEQFIELWETVWGDGPSLEQTRLAMKHTLFRVSVWDGDLIVAMARMMVIWDLITILRMLLSDLNIREKVSERC